MLSTRDKLAALIETDNAVIKNAIIEKLHPIIDESKLDVSKIVSHLRINPTDKPETLKANIENWIHKLPLKPASTAKSQSESSRLYRAGIIAGEIKDEVSHLLKLAQQSQPKKTQTAKKRSTIDAGGNIELKSDEVKPVFDILHTLEKTLLNKDNLTAWSKTVTSALGVGGKAITVSKQDYTMHSHLAEMIKQLQAWKNGKNAPETLQNIIKIAAGMPDVVKAATESKYTPLKNLEDQHKDIYVAIYKNLGKSPFHDIDLPKALTQLQTDLSKIIITVNGKSKSIFDKAGHQQEEEKKRQDALVRERKEKEAKEAKEERENKNNIDQMAKEAKAAIQLKEEIRGELTTIKEDWIAKVNLSKGDYEEFYSPKRESVRQSISKPIDKQMSELKDLTLGALTELRDTIKSLKELKKPEKSSIKEQDITDLLTSKKLVNETTIRPILESIYITPQTIITTAYSEAMEAKDKADKIKAEQELKELEQRLADEKTDRQLAATNKLEELRKEIKSAEAKINEAETFVNKITAFVTTSLNPKTTEADLDTPRQDAAKSKQLAAEAKDLLETIKQHKAEAESEAKRADLPPIDIELDALIEKVESVTLLAESNIATVEAISKTITANTEQDAKENLEREEKEKKEEQARLKNEADEKKTEQEALERKKTEEKTEKEAAITTLKEQITAAGKNWSETLPDSKEYNLEAFKTKITSAAEALLANISDLVSDLKTYQIQYLSNKLSEITPPPSDIDFDAKSEQDPYYLKAIIPEHEGITSALKSFHKEAQTQLVNAKTALADAQEKERLSNQARQQIAGEAAMKDRIKTQIATTPALSDAKNDLANALVEIAAADSPQKIREAILKHQNQLGAADLNALKGHANDETILGQPVTEEIKKHAVEKLMQLKKELIINKIQGILNLDNAEDKKALSDLANTAVGDMKAVRQEILANKANLGGATFLDQLNGNENNDTILSGQFTAEIQAAASAQYKKLLPTALVNETISKITDLTKPAKINLLVQIEKAGDDKVAIRNAIYSARTELEGKSEAVFAELKTSPDKEDILNNDSVNAIKENAKTKLTTLRNDLEVKIANTVTPIIADLKNHAHRKAALAIADAKDIDVARDIIIKTHVDPFLDATIRQTLLLNPDILNLDLVTKIQTDARTKLMPLRQANIIKTLTDIIADSKDDKKVAALSEIASAVSPEAVRKAILDHKNQFGDTISGVDAIDDKTLNNATVTAIQDLAKQKQILLLATAAINAIPSPADAKKIDALLGLEAAGADRDKLREKIYANKSAFGGAALDTLNGNFSTQNILTDQYAGEIQTTAKLKLQSLRSDFILSEIKAATADNQDKIKALLAIESDSTKTNNEIREIIFNQKTLLGGETLLDAKGIDIKNTDFLTDAAVADIKDAVNTRLSLIRNSLKTDIIKKIKTADITTDTPDPKDLIKALLIIEEVKPGDDKALHQAILQVTNNESTSFTSIINQEIQSAVQAQLATQRETLKKSFSATLDSIKNLDTKESREALLAVADAKEAKDDFENIRKAIITLATPPALNASLTANPTILTSDLVTAFQKEARQQLMDLREQEIIKSIGKIANSADAKTNAALKQIADAKTPDEIRTAILGQKEVLKIDTFFGAVINQNTFLSNIAAQAIAANAQTKQIELLTKPAPTTASLIDSVRKYSPKLADILETTDVKNKILEIKNTGAKLPSPIALIESIAKENKDDKQGIAKSIADAFLRAAPGVKNSVDELLLSIKNCGKLEGTKPKELLGEVRHMHIISEYYNSLPTPPSTVDTLFLHLLNNPTIASALQKKLEDPNVIPPTVNALTLLRQAITDSTDATQLTTAFNKAFEKIDPPINFDDPALLTEITIFRGEARLNALEKDIAQSATYHKDNKLEVLNEIISNKPYRDDLRTHLQTKTILIKNPTNFIKEIAEAKNAADAQTIFVAKGFLLLPTPAAPLAGASPAVPPVVNYQERLYGHAKLAIHLEEKTQYDLLTPNLQLRNIFIDSKEVRAALADTYGKGTPLPTSLPALLMEKLATIPDINKADLTTIKQAINTSLGIPSGTDIAVEPDHSQGRLRHLVLIAQLEKTLPSLATVFNNHIIRQILYTHLDTIGNVIDVDKLVKDLLAKDPTKITELQTHLQTIAGITDKNLNDAELTQGSALHDSLKAELKKLEVDITFTKGEFVTHLRDYLLAKSPFSDIKSTVERDKIVNDFILANKINLQTLNNPDTLRKGPPLAKRDAKDLAERVGHILLDNTGISINPSDKDSYKNLSGIPTNFVFDSKNPTQTVKDFAFPTQPLKDAIVALADQFQPAHVKALQAAGVVNQQTYEKSVDKQFPAPYETLNKLFKNPAVRDALQLAEIDDSTKIAIIIGVTSVTSQPSDKSDDIQNAIAKEIATEIASITKPSINKSALEKAIKAFEVKGTILNTKEPKTILGEGRHAKLIYEPVIQSIPGLEKIFKDAAIQKSLIQDMGTKKPDLFKLLNDLSHVTEATDAKTFAQSKKDMYKIFENTFGTLTSKVLNRLSIASNADELNLLIQQAKYFTYIRENFAGLNSLTSALTVKPLSSAIVANSLSEFKHANTHADGLKGLKEKLIAADTPDKVKHAMNGVLMIPLVKTPDDLNKIKEIRAEAAYLALKNEADKLGLGSLIASSGKDIIKHFSETDAAGKFTNAFDLSTFKLQETYAKLRETSQDKLSEELKNLNLAAPLQDAHKNLTSSKNLSADVMMQVFMTAVKISGRRPLLTALLEDPKNDLGQSIKNYIHNELVRESGTLKLKTNEEARKFMNQILDSTDRSANTLRACFGQPSTAIHDITLQRIMDENQAERTRNNLLSNIENPIVRSAYRRSGIDFESDPVKAEAQINKINTTLRNKPDSTFAEIDAVANTTQKLAAISIDAIQYIKPSSATTVADSKGVPRPITPDDQRERLEISAAKDQAQINNWYLVLPVAASPQSHIEHLRKILIQKPVEIKAAIADFKVLNDFDYKGGDWKVFQAVLTTMKNKTDPELDTIITENQFSKLKILQKVGSEPEKFYNHAHDLFIKLGNANKKDSVTNRLERTLNYAEGLLLSDAKANAQKIETNILPIKTQITQLKQDIEFAVQVLVQIRNSIQGVIDANPTLSRNDALEKIKADPRFQTPEWKDLLIKIEPESNSLATQIISLQRQLRKFETFEARTLQIENDATAYKTHTFGFGSSSQVKDMKDFQSFINPTGKIPNDPSFTSMGAGAPGVTKSKDSIDDIHFQSNLVNEGKKGKEIKWTERLNESKNIISEVWVIPDTMKIDHIFKTALGDDPKFSSKNPDINKKDPNHPMMKVIDSCTEALLEKGIPITKANLIAELNNHKEIIDQTISASRTMLLSSKIDALADTLIAAYTKQTEQSYQRPIKDDSRKVIKWDAPNRFPSDDLIALAIRQVCGLVATQGDRAFKYPLKIYKTFDPNYVRAMELYVAARNRHAPANQQILLDTSACLNDHKSINTHAVDYFEWLLAERTHNLHREFGATGAKIDEMRRNEKRTSPNPILELLNEKYPNGGGTILGLSFTKEAEKVITATTTEIKDIEASAAAKGLRRP